MAEGQARRPGTGEARFAAYLDALAAVLGGVRRAASARAYCTGLLLPGARKSVEPMAARIAPGRVQAEHQSMHHVVAKAEWDDAALLRAVRDQALPAIEEHGPVRYWSPAPRLSETPHKRRFPQFPSELACNQEYACRPPATPTWVAAAGVGQSG
jgi:SRSO17 transposase